MKVSHYVIRKERGLKLKRVLHFLSGLSAGGAETMVMNIYRNVDHEKIRFDFIVFNERSSFYTEEIKKLGGRIFTVNPIRKVGIWKFIKEVKKVIYEYGPFDIVHSHIDYLSGFVMLAARLSGIKIRISHSHNTQALTYKGNLKGLRLLVARELIIKNSTNLFACSIPAAEYMFGVKYATKSTIINNAIDLQKFSNKKEFNYNTLCRKLSLDNSYDYYIHIGRFVEQKNHKTLIDIFEIFHNNNSNAKLLLLGEGKLQDEIKAYVQKKRMENYVIFLGNRENVQEFLYISKAFLLPSLFEGLPVTLIEAQAMNVPCVISDNINKDVDCGLNLLKFIPLNDLSKWVEVIEKVAMHRTYKDNTLVMREKGYDILYNIQKIYKIYGVDV